MSEHFEVAIIGAGPAGIGAATSAASHSLSHVLFEKAELANTIYQYQLHKHVMAEPARLPLRAKCRFEAGSREKILEEFAEDVAKHKVNVVRAEVTAVRKAGERFEIEYQGKTCTATHIILAVGVQGTPRKIGVPGEELSHVSYSLMDAAAFQARHIAVIGAGDAAIENALALSKQNTVYLVNRGAEFARAKDANVRQILNAISSGTIRCFYNTTVARIEPTTMYLNTPEGEVSVPCDHIIARLGGIPPRKFIESIGIEFPNAEPTAVPVVSERYESNVPNLYILGALIGYPLIKQAINQGFEVIEHLRGNPVQPADQELLEERFANVIGGFSENFPKIRANLPLFRDLSAPQFREMVIESTLRTFDAGEMVFERNDYTDSFYSIVSGEVEIEIDATRRVRLSQGQFFGEMGLLSGRRRNATVRASQANTLLVETPRKQMIKLMASVNSVRRSLDELFMLRAMQTSIFPEAPAPMLEEMAKRATLRHFKKGDVLFTEGELGDVMHVIRKGSVKVSRQSRHGVDVAQTYIAAGHVVGEMAILKEEPTPRTATVTAAVACDTIALEKKDVRDLFERHPEVRVRFERLADERRIQNVVDDWSERSGSLLDFMMREGLTDADNVLLIDSDLCVGCDNCETACAATHGGYSRLDRKGGKSFAAVQIPISCRHCENPLCMLDCPPDALTRTSSGEVIIRDSCIGCGNCVSNCPYGVIKMVYDSVDSGWSLWSLLGRVKKEKGPAKAAKCDMCRDLDGGPACVRACPTGAAMRVNATRLIQIAGSKRI